MLRIPQERPKPIFTCLSRPVLSRRVQITLWGSFPGATKGCLRQSWGVLWDIWWLISRSKFGKGRWKKWRDAGCPQIITAQNYLRPQNYLGRHLRRQERLVRLFPSLLHSGQEGEATIGLWNVRNPEKKRRLNKIQSESVLCQLFGIKFKFHNFIDTIFTSVPVWS